MMHILCVYRWGGQYDYVFAAMAGDFMKPRINEVLILPVPKSKIIVHIAYIINNLSLAIYTCFTQ